MHGGKDNAKHLKFRGHDFDPGVIVVDVSGCNVQDNENRLAPWLKLRPEAMVRNDARGYVYDLALDPEFGARPENQGNIVSYAIEYFQQIDKSKYSVRALLVGISMRFVRLGDKLVSPKGAFMIVDRRYPGLAIQELAPAVYLVDEHPVREGVCQEAPG